MRRSAKVLAFVLIGLCAVLVARACGTGTNAPEVSLSDAQMPANDGQTNAVLYLRVANDGGVDQIVGASSPRADRITLHKAEFDGDQVSMLPTDEIEVPHGGLTMTSGSSHVMLHDIGPALELGETIPVMLDLERTGEVEVQAVVTTYEDAVAFLEGTE